jgi:hypothetical protein
MFTGLAAYVLYSIVATRNVSKCQHKYQRITTAPIGQEGAVLVGELPSETEAEAQATAILNLKINVDHIQYHREHYRVEE